MRTSARRFRFVIGCLSIALGCAASTIFDAAKLSAQDVVSDVQIITAGEGPVFKVNGSGPVPVAISSSVGALGVDPNNKSNLLRLLENESIKRELKLTEQQQQGAKRISEEANRQMRDSLREMIQSGKSVRDPAMATMMAENRQKMEGALEEILLPEQLKRIRQLAYQVEIARIGLGESLTDGRLGKEIGVTDNQKQHLSEKAAAIENEVRAAVAKIRAAAQAQLLRELSTEQRQEAEKLLGDYFYYEEPTLEQRVRQQIKANQPAAAPAQGAR